ncbi:MAG: Rieske (2Fe-2S) protein [Ferrimicrobium sp.]
MMETIIGSSTDFPEGESRRVVVGKTAIVVVRLGGELYAIGDICSHAHYFLSEGEIYPEEKEIECWKHGSTFSLIDGKPQCFPATAAVPVFNVVERDGAVAIDFASQEGTR